MHRSVPGTRDLFWGVCTSLAIAVPSLLFYQTSPSPSFSNQDASVAGWSIFLAVLAATIPRGVYPRAAASLALLAAILLLLIVDIASPLVTHAPLALIWTSAGAIVGSALTLTIGACARRIGLAEPVFKALCVALIFAGLANSLIGLAQVFAPGIADGSWISQPVSIGRATGNLRQPNNLSGLLLWSIVAAVWLHEATVIQKRTAMLLSGLFLFVIVLSASRTGAASTLLFVVWGVADKRLARRTRTLLCALPLAYAFLWSILALGANHTHQVFGGLARFDGSGIAATTRYGVWLDSLALIASHPWLGVGFGGFNFAWTMTPVQHRPPEGFDHAHNLLLQLTVELGVPCALLVFLLLAYAAWRAMRVAINAPHEDSSVVRASVMMLGLIGFHSMLEYPLWYTSGLLPTAFLAGLCADRRNTCETEVATVPDSDVARPLVLGSLVLFLAAVFAYTDYQRLAVIYTPNTDARLLSRRISAGRESVLFAHYADYIAATASEDPAALMSVFPAATHHLLDPKLMMAWANALSERGDIDKARYIARRLAEFHSDQTMGFFEPCPIEANEGRIAQTPLPYQCVEPSRSFRYEDFQ